MTQTGISSAAGTLVIKGGSGQAFTVQVTKAGAGALTLYDNATTGSGRVIWQGDGTSVGSYDISDGNGSGCVATQGLTFVQVGTANVVIVYQ